MKKIRCSVGNKDKRSDDISIIVKKDKTIDDLTRSLKKNKRTADLARSPKNNIAPGHRFEDLDFLGYPKRPTNVSNGESMILKFLTSHMLCDFISLLYHYQLTVPFVFKQMV